MTLDPARRWSASAKWTSDETGTLARRHHDRLRSPGRGGRGTASHPGGWRVLQPRLRPDAEAGAAARAGLHGVRVDRRARGDSGDTAPYAVEREMDELDALVGADGASAFVGALPSGASSAPE